MTNIASLRLSGGAFALAALLLWAGIGVTAESPQARLQSVSDELLEQIRLRMDEFKRDDEALYTFVDATLGGVLDYVISAETPDSRRRAEIEAGFERSTPFFRRLIGDRGGLRYVPKLRFVLDDTEDRAERIESLLETSTRAKTAP